MVSDGRIPHHTKAKTHCNPERKTQDLDYLAISGCSSSTVNGTEHLNKKQKAGDQLRNN
jgi:hypothetical protein